MELYTLSPNFSADTAKFYRQIYNNMSSGALGLNYSSNVSSGCHLNTHSIEHYLSVKILLAILYSVIFFTAVSGNLLVIYVVVFNKHMHTVTNFFITNLAISDLMVNLTSLWLTPLYTYLKRWVWGGAMCHIFPCAQGMALFISTMTLTAIAIDRYIVILYPFAQRISIQLCLTVTVSIWILSFMLVVPYTINMKHVFIPICDKYLCLEAWMDQKFKAVFGVVVMVLQFGIPFIIITFCYICIWMRLITRANQSLAHSSGELQRKRRMAKMLTSMVVIFALCCLPVNALNVLRDLKWTDENFTLYFLFGHVCQMSATCWNPILYAWMNEYFQREFKAVLPCFVTVNHRHVARSLSLTRSINKSTVANNRPRQSLAVGVLMEPNNSTALIKDKTTNLEKQPGSTTESDSPKDNSISCLKKKESKTRFDLPDELSTTDSAQHDTSATPILSTPTNGSLRMDIENINYNNKNIRKQKSLDAGFGLGDHQGFKVQRLSGNAKKYSNPNKFTKNGQCKPLLADQRIELAETGAGPNYLNLSHNNIDDYIFGSDEEGTPL